MTVHTSTSKIVIKSGEYIMPKASKPTQSARPKPAPKPLVSKPAK